MKMSIRGAMAAAGLTLMVVAAGAKEGSRESAWALIHERTAILKDDVASFTLTLSPRHIEASKPHYELTLSCAPAEAKRAVPFELHVPISTHAACAIVDHLATTGFMAGAQEWETPEGPEGRAEGGYRLSVGVGGGKPRIYGVSLGWGLNAIRDIEALRDAARGEEEAVKAFDLLLGRLSGWKAQWEREAAEREKEAAARAEAERIERPASLTLTVSVSGDGHSVVAQRDGRDVWSVRLSEPAEHAAIVPPDRVVVQPGNRVFDLLTGKQLPASP